MTLDSLSVTFAALADPTRRAILARLMSSEVSVSKLPAVTKHLDVLERAGLIVRGREAQWRPCRLQAAPLKAAAGWIAEYRHIWEQRLDRLDDYLHELQKKGKQNVRKKK
jgi:DNA-binding transcriptional ArsR family regulator